MCKLKEKIEVVLNMWREDADRLRHAQKHLEYYDKCSSGVMVEYQTIREHISEIEEALKW